MPDDPVIPHIEQTNRQLKDIQATETAIQVEIQGQTQTVRAGFEHLHQGMKAQTETIAELEIMGRLAQLQALKELIEQEESLIDRERIDDAASVQALVGEIEHSRADIEGLRNQRVGELLQPVYELLDHDLKDDLEERVAGLKDGMASCLEVLEGAVGVRDDILKTVVAAAHEAVEALVAQRHQAQSAIRDVEFSPHRLKGCSAPAVVGLPFLVVEIVENGGRSSRLQVVPPSHAVADESHPAGFALQAFPGLDQVARSLEGGIAQLSKALTDAIRWDDVRFSGPLFEVTGGLLSRLALRSLWRDANERTVRVGQEDPRKPPDAPPKAYEQGTTVAEFEEEL